MSGSLHRCHRRIAAEIRRPGPTRSASHLPQTREMLSLRLAGSNARGPDILNITPTPITAALAGLVAGIAMPIFWMRLVDDTMLLLVAFLLVVALPAHALVVGFGPQQSANARTVDTALLKRAVVWLLAAALAMGVTQALRT